MDNNLEITKTDSEYGADEIQVKTPGHVYRFNRAARPAPSGI